MPPVETLTLREEGLRPVSPMSSPQGPAVRLVVRGGSREGCSDTAGVALIP